MRAVIAAILCALVAEGAWLAPADRPAVVDAASALPTGKILFTVNDFSGPGGAPGIYVAERDGSGAKRIAYGTDPTFSPDGQRVAFTGADDIGDSFIYSVAVGGGARRRESGPLLDPPPPPVDANGPYDVYSHTHPKYRPDGQGIVYFEMHEHYDDQGTCDLEHIGFNQAVGDGGDAYLLTSWSSCEAVPDDLCYPAGVQASDFSLGGPWPSTADPSATAYDLVCGTTGIVTAQLLRPSGNTPLLANAEIAGGWTPDGRILLVRDDPDGRHDVLVTTSGQATRWSHPNPQYARAIGGCNIEVSPEPLGVVFSPDGQLSGWSETAYDSGDPPAPACTSPHAGIWLADASGANPREVVEGENAVLQDLQCTPGNCLTGIVITKAFGPTTGIAAFPSTFTYGGAITDARTWRADPFNPPSAETPLIARLSAGTYTITEGQPPGWRSLDVACTGAPFTRTGAGSVTVQLGGGLATCAFTSDWDGHTPPTGQTPGPTLPVTCTPPATRYLPVALRGQHTENWCWAASSQMVMAFLGKFVEQGQEANDAFGRTDCLDEPVVADCVHGSWPHMERYGFILDQTAYGTALSWDDLTKQIGCLGKPVLFTWIWVGRGFGHAMVAAGYTSTPGARYVQVDDPWPVDQGDSYLVPYENWVASPRSLTVPGQSDPISPHTHAIDYYDVTLP